MIDQIIQRKICLFVNAFFISTFCSVAQDYDFQKQIIKESLNPKTMLKQSDGLPYKSLQENPVTIETDPAKMKIPMNASFNHQLDSFLRACQPGDPDGKYAVSPYFTTPYTNKEIPFYEYYNAESVFMGGQWVPASSLFGVGLSLLMYLYNKGIIPNDDPVLPTKSKKQKALERIKKVYDMND